MSNQPLGIDEAFALGEMDAFYKRAVEKVKVTIRGQKFAGMEPDDVIQETLIKIHRAMPKYDGSKAKVGTYVETIIRNMVKDSFKKCSSTANLSVVNAASLSSTATHSMFNSEEADEYTFDVGGNDYGYEVFEVVTDLMENLGLTDREREVFKLRAAGYENCEIAELIGVSRSRVTQIWGKIQEKYNTAD